MSAPLSPEEVEALLRRVDDGAEPERTRPAPDPSAIYDFKRPERVSKSQVFALEALHVDFARDLSTSLSRYLRTLVEVRLAGTQPLTYSEFAMSLPSPTSFNLLSCEPLEGHIILEMNPSILFPIIDRLLGGGSCETRSLDRPFTNLEMGLVNTILSRIIDQLRETWEDVKQIDFQLFETESNPFLLQIAAPNEPVVLLSFEVRLGTYSGMIHLCIPLDVIEPILSEVAGSNGLGVSRPADIGQGRQQILVNIGNAPLELTGILAESRLRLTDVLTLKPGDIIDTDRNWDSQVILCVAGAKKYRGEACIHRGRKAVRITGPVTANRAGGEGKRGERGDAEDRGDHGTPPESRCQDRDPLS